MKLSQKSIITFSCFLAAILSLSFCFYINVTAESTYADYVYVCKTELPNGSYLANDSDEPTTTKPETGGYVYYKDGVITLNNAIIGANGSDFQTTPGILATSDITVQLIGNNQIGIPVDSIYTLPDDQIYIGILAAENVHSHYFYDVSVTGSGNLTIYDSSKGVLGYNVTIDMTGNLNIFDYGTEDIAVAECCLKADGGSLYINNGNLDLRSYLSCCMYADDGIYITAGNIATRTSSMGGNHALNCEPVFDSDQYNIEVSNEINVETSVEMEAWNKTDDLSSFLRVNFTNTSLATTPTPSPVPTPNATQSPTPTPTTTPNATLNPTTTPSTTLSPVPTPNATVTDDKSVSVKKLSWKSLKNKKTKKAVASWKKIKKATAYELQYATSKTFKAKKSVQTKKTNYTIKKLKKKTYYVRVRAYKLDGQKKVYGKWSKIKKITIKK